MTLIEFISQSKSMGRAKATGGYESRRRSGRVGATFIFQAADRVLGRQGASSDLLRAAYGQPAGSTLDNSLCLEAEVDPHAFRIKSAGALIFRWIDFNGAVPGRRGADPYTHITNLLTTGTCAGYNDPVKSMHYRQPDECENHI